MIIQDCGCLRYMMWCCEVDIEEYILRDCSVYMLIRVTV
jgi:hypothetical protein